ncbi:MAG TPA: mechanosensitive ion channel family protein [Ktedonobacteraceae bacterium]|jgi:small-conductance mechanosensitive channel|nr:mechanosensitive ion channel family protein [Ktedonobacteraceae bacterium]
MVLGNTLSNCLYALVAFLIALSLSLVFKYIILNRLKSLTEHTKNTIDDVIVSMFVSIKLPVYIVIAFYIAIQFLVLHATIRKIIDAIFIISVVYQLVTVVLIFLDYSVAQRVKAANGSSAAHIRDMIQLIVKVSLWAFGLLFILSNLGINVTSLVAGFGIGGVAVALAVQSILGDLFSYFAIYFDKPFVKDDFIIVGTQMGIVEKVGIKTTRIRALQGEELVIPNSELTSTRIQNFKKMQERRIVFSFNVAYETPLEKLEKIPHHVRDIITASENTRFDRAHLLSFGNSAYLFEVVYYVLSGNYNTYMDIQQAINFQLITAFSEENIEFAYPTQTVHLTPNR